jgi:hypothetical protein
MEVVPEIRVNMQMSTKQSTTNAMIRWHVLLGFNLQLCLMDSGCPLPHIPDITPTGDLHVQAQDDYDIIAKK